MNVHLPSGVVHSGRAIDLSETNIAPERVVASIRDTDSSADSLRIECPEPGPGHELLARLPVSNVSTPRLLTAVGRSRGLSTPVDGEIGRLTERLADHTVPDDHSAKLRAVRRRLADAGDDEARLRERTATLRGRLAAHREAGDAEAIDATRSELVDVATKLSEVETERIAAEERLDALEREATRVRDTRDERLRLTDALANRRREARTHFADELAAEFAEAKRELAEMSPAATPPDATPPDAVVASLATVRLADLRAPVVSTCRFFPDAETAVRSLDTPVVRM
ncbi:hypothetical protein [Haloferax sp. YSSS75]|uniref:DUF7856 family protein n=1 Tax=Haloferax sp. YSSS75 TaxID=3388564 RepID=UPI00398CEF37